MSNVLELQGRIAQMEAQRNGAMNDAAVLAGRLNAAMQRVTELEKRLEELTPKNEVEE